MESSVVRKQRLWVYAILPVLVLNVGGFLIYGVYYAMAAVQPRLVAHIPPGQLTFAAYLLTAAVVWSLAYSIIRTARHHKTPLMILVAPQGLRTLKWGPAVGIFLL